jgi:aryl sulfotransferase
MQLVRPTQREYRTWLIDNRRWAPYQPRAADIIISTPPKCGTTWMQQIVGVFQDSEARPLNVVSPWIDGRAGRTEETHHAIEAQKHRRFLKSHTPLDGLPLHDGVRYIFVGRDGRDALMSLHNFLFNLTDRIFEVLDRIGLDDPMIGRALPRNT